MRDPIRLSPEFRRLREAVPGEGPDPDLVRIGLEIAGDVYPGLDPVPYLTRVEEFVGRVRDRCASPDRPRQVIGQINWVLFVEEGFHGNGDAYDDPRNSYLNEVIDRKKGIPISLSVLYWRVAERLGLPMAGVGLPAHFVLRVGTGRDEFFVDPFHSGAVLDRSGCRRLVARRAGREVSITDTTFEGCSRAEVVTRMLRNLKGIYLGQGEYTAAVAVQQRLAFLSPGDPGEQRDLGMLYLRLDRPFEAIPPLESFLDLSPNAPESAQIRTLLRTARRETAARN